MPTSQEHLTFRIISGGQSGVDRRALDAAIELDIEHGGWCPKGRLAEDGRIPDRYQLEETESTEYPVRTEQNVLDSEGTLILFRGKLQGGTELTRRLAMKHGKPLFVLDLDETPDPREVTAWLSEQAITTLNIAGPRESSDPGIGKQAFAFLVQMLSRATLGG